MPFVKNLRCEGHSAGDFFSLSHKIEKEVELFCYATEENQRGWIICKSCHCGLWTKSNGFI